MQNLEQIPLLHGVAPMVVGTKDVQLPIGLQDRGLSIAARKESAIQSVNLTTYIYHVHYERERRKYIMGFDQYHEPPGELPEETRTFARMMLSMIEEAQAIDWYEQRMAVEKDTTARAIMQNAQQEEFKHFGMDLEFLLRKKAKWRAILKDILFTEGDIVAHGEKAEDEAG